MSGSVDARLREFTSRLLQQHGAEVDWPAEADEGLALLPGNVAQTLRCLEILPLAPDSGSPLPINLSSDFLDRVEPLVCAAPQIVSLQIPTAYLKRSDMAEPVARAEYHTWYLLATLDSADRWQQVVRVTVNAASGAQIPSPDMLDASLLLAEPADLPTEYPSTELAAVRAALGRVETDSRAFVERLEGRLGRDRKRLQEYYRALLWGDRKRSARRGGDEDPDQKEAKAKAVQFELRRKLAELDERYACRVDLTPLALVRTDCPALAVRCHVLRRSTARMCTIFWNPLSKELEPLCCSHCGISTFSLAFSDDKVAPLCAACHR